MRCYSGLRKRSKVVVWDKGVDAEISDGEQRQSYREGLNLREFLCYIRSGRSGFSARGSSLI